MRNKSVELCGIKCFQRGKKLDIIKALLDARQAINRFNHQYPHPAVRLFDASLAR